MAQEIPGKAQGEATQAVTSPATFQVVGGYLVAHLPGENVTVVAQSAPPVKTGEDSGWASWTQRGGLLWRGEMDDSQGRHYNVRILPGYVAPWNMAVEGWQSAGTDMQEYGQARMWKRIGRQSKETFKWSWKDCFWEFGLKGSGKAWSEGFEAARRRTERKTFGWPLAYPWAVISSAFETLIRVPVATVGAVGGTAVAGIIVPAGNLVWPAGKATYHAGVEGLVFPVAGWTWQTIAAPPTALFASAPTPSRADGLWMTMETPHVASPSPAPQGLLAMPPLSAPGVDVLARYAQQASSLDQEERQMRQRDMDELNALRARQAEAMKGFREAREKKLKAWAEDPQNQQALQAVLAEGADGTAIRNSRAQLERRLMELGLSAEQANRAVNMLVDHPLMKRAVVPTKSLPQKTDPLQGALETVDRVMKDGPR